MLKDVLRILIYEIFLEIFLGKREKQLILTHKSGTNITLDNLFFVKKKKNLFRYNEFLFNPSKVATQNCFINSSKI